MRYMLLVYGCDRPDPASPEMQGKRAAVNAFIDLCRERGVFLAADPLHGVETATTVRVQHGETLITDGPFAETREWLAGYFLLDCRDLDEALELAALCPLAAEGPLEVRPVLERGVTRRMAG